MSMGQRQFLRIAALLGALGVVLGAFGAHGLRERLSDDLLAAYEVGVRYHIYHAVAMLAAACAPDEWWRAVRMRFACSAWLVGVLVFSGSLYVLALTGIRGFGAITPIGGVAFIAGWLALVLPARNRPGN